MVSRSLGDEAFMNAFGLIVNGFGLDIKVTFI